MIDLLDASLVTCMLISSILSQLALGCYLFLLQTLAAENVALENQLLELKSTNLRMERECTDASAAVSKLEAQLSRLGSSAGQQGQELQQLQTERRILKARLMQVSSR